MMGRGGAHRLPLVRRWPCLLWWALLTALLCLPLRASLGQTDSSSATGAGTARTSPADSSASGDALRDRVVLLHGVGRSSLALAVLRYRLHVAGFATHSVGYRSLGDAPVEILEDVSAKIDACCRVIPDGARLHFVGHSFGGLVVRAYLARTRPRNLGRVVLMGTPNQGSAVADYFAKWRVSDYLPTVRALTTGEGGLAQRLPDPDYEVGVIAGDRPIASTLDDLLGDSHDGLVSVESTRLEGMSDFVVLPVTHVGMRNDEAVAAQVVAFLRTGRFVAGAVR